MIEHESHDSVTTENDRWLRGRRRLTRRALLRGAGRATVGAAGLALVGCGGDDDAPSLPPVAAEGSQDQPQAAVEQQTVEQQAADQQAPVEQQAAEQQAPAQQAAPEPDAEDTPAQVRRLLDPDRRCDDCTLEDPQFAAAFGSRVRFGIDDGAAWRMEVPPTWNGTLLLWGRGFSGLNDAGTAFNSRIGFGAFPFRELLLAAGIGWAASTYRSNGFVAAHGVDELLKTKDRFVSEFRTPSTTVCVGASMGGATAQLMAQEFPDEIDGALALCGALSNVEVVDYLAAFHALALYFIGEPPSTTDSTGLNAWGARLGSPDGAGGLALTPVGEQFVAVVQELTGGERWGFEEGLAEQWQTNFALGSTVWPLVMLSGQALAPGSIVEHDASTVAFDTRALTYSAPADSGIDIDALNEQVIRFAAPDGSRENPALGPASGSLKVPLLTLKGTGDLFTPISLDQSYRRLVDAQGDSANLVQRAVRRAGHCDFSTDESVAAFLDFAAWIAGGQPPQGEDLRGDLIQAGVAFTDPFDAGDPLAPGS
ncbi:MAG: hypothetical protein O6913_10300 [Chloroflexi bacterium]|nr:hypothetical protein [Chloroflexota bacterium]